LGESNPGAIPGSDKDAFARVNMPEVPMECLLVHSVMCNKIFL
jgi:hypothetical protein